MLLLKNLPTVREPRLYLSMERTYLSYIKFLFVAFGTGILSKKLTILLAALKLYGLIPFFVDLYDLLTWPVLILLFLVFYLFISDLRYINSGISVTAHEIQDPRIYFSAERTFLSWIRAGISILIFGFVMEKFDFFLKKLAFMMHKVITIHTIFSGMDTVFLILGIVNVSVGIWGFFLTVYQVDQGAYHPHIKLYIFYGVALFVSVGILGYLLLKVLIG
ncbi:MAG: YidH family protein [Acidithiobacillus sp.]